MKASSIQIGKKYEVSVGRGTSTVTVIGINPKTGGWVCETKGGKDMTIGDASRFIKPVAVGKDTKKEKGETQPEAVPKAVLRPSERPQKGKPKAASVVVTESIEQLRDAFKEADRRLRIARNAFQTGLIDNEKLRDTTSEYDEALAVLKAAGGKAGSGGRCLGQMSSLEAAYKILSESGKPMNARQICEMAIDSGYWEPQGTTPEATLSSAIITEMRKKGAASRFERVGRGLFTVK